MREQTFDGRLGRPLVIDICFACQVFWFDERESLSLTPGSTLTLFRLIGEHVAKPQASRADTAKCPRCRSRLRRTSDMQRTTRFEYWRCPHAHGRLTTFFDFLREKDFIRPLTPAQLAELRQNVQMVNCSNCGAPVDLTIGAACTHCGSPLSMLDLTQAEALVARLQRADDRTSRPIDPALPMELARARREVDVAFSGLERDDVWFREVSAAGLVGAGLSAVARWLKRNEG
jgi:DNA-directed RNA polymerase subunit RPC12/RpoP